MFYRKFVRIILLKTDMWFTLLKIKNKHWCNTVLIFQIKIYKFQNRCFKTGTLRIEMMKLIHTRLNATRIAPVPPLRIATDVWRVAFKTFHAIFSFCVICQASPSFSQSSYKNIAKSQSGIEVKSDKITITHIHLNFLICISSLEFLNNCLWMHHYIPIYVSLRNVHTPTLSVLNV